eukprot:7219452-Prymnesium_polylepis.1
MAAIAPTEGASTAHVRAVTWIGAQHACAAAATWTMAPLPVEDDAPRGEHGFSRSIYLVGAVCTTTRINTP